MCFSFVPLLFSALAVSYRAYFIFSISMLLLSSCVRIIVDLVDPSLIMSVIDGVLTGV
jgi:hypothetical protein